MIELSLRKTDFNGILGFSCIENYVLAVLAKRLNHTYLYFESYVGLAEAVEEIVINGVGFADQRSIPRIHHTAAAAGVINCSRDKADDIQKAVCLPGHICVEVRPDWFRTRYREETWRSDHYIMISEYTASEYIIINDLPRDEAVISLTEARSLFAGNVFRFLVNSEEMQKHEEGFLTKFRLSLRKARLEAIVPQELTLKRFRDFLGVIKISRRRMKEFCGNYFDVSFFDEYLDNLDRCFVSIEYMRLRNKNAVETLREMLRAIFDKDAIFMRELSNLVEGRKI
jgi:hypothetical protein